MVFSRAQSHAHWLSAGHEQTRAPRVSCLMGQPRWMPRRPPLDKEQLSGQPTSAFSWPLCCWFYIHASRLHHTSLVPDPLTGCCQADHATHVEAHVEAATTSTHIELSSPLAQAQTQWPAVDRTPRTKSRSQTTLLTIGPPYMWIVMLSVVEWEHLTDDQKELYQ
jgi:hypothetical protein